ncbi:hypothetical protein [Nocardioides sp. YIM 152315]|uniref:hypothetical protein n=1 Tax=Nocardioides sp. YIM 152315 TaxID=3031760 RepID=UPI0023D9A0AE|nr:hypothetical protein [Nocardioides sp. YIM 152315]
MGDQHCGVGRADRLRQLGLERRPVSPGDEQLVFADSDIAVPIAELQLRARFGRG